jgi:2-keto-3-deoxy-galactonokinase
MVEEKKIDKMKGLGKGHIIIVPGSAGKWEEVKMDDMKRVKRKNEG